ncbi:hypothetical protein Glove_476g35 [Diversispora epigaea]|uniref:Uncharacterized protein n=1 Tax=Diversispora epigaea TaxID=1348612 RepID=A0A397GRG0_9GLOM|nr:hypothetical protein Glove_476g35 [Diversispora epigaea]
MQGQTSSWNQIEITSFDRSAIKTDKQMLMEYEIFGIMESLNIDKEMKILQKLEQPNVKKTNHRNDLSTHYYKNVQLLK